MDQIIEAIRNPKTKVVSFDVFDTLVLRPFWVPSDLFMFLDKEASELFHTSDIIRFSEFRRSYELEARDKIKESGKEDLTITDIYNYIADDSPYPTDVLNSLMEKEKELEFRFCYARSSTQQLVQAAVSSGKHVIAVSDMYLPTEFIKSLLENCGINSIERIFVSGEIGLTKRSGHLYEHVAEEMGVRCQEIVHIGDNAKTDVRVPRKMSIRAFFYPRTIALMSKGQTGSAYRHAYEQIRSSFSNYHATEELGIRCMLAVAANRVYDNPFHDDRTGGDYAGDTSLFGNLALGMYAFAHGLWVYRLAQEKHYDHVLFFARDGYLPYLAYEMLRDNGEEDVPQAEYVRTSRKALLPLLITRENGPFKAGVHMRYLDHTPKSVTRLMNSVLQENADLTLQKKLGEAWLQPFKNETDMVKYIYGLHINYLDKKKADSVETGVKAYFEPLVEGNVLTYDIGYNLRNETVLREFFPDARIDACFTHGVDDIAIKRGIQSDINIHMFYSSTPFVSWLPRELFMAEHTDSCVGYEIDGKPIMDTGKEFDKILVDIQDYAIHYMEEFISIFGKEIHCLPFQLSNACQPLETFLHTPQIADRKWFRYINADNDAASGTRLYQCYDFWRRQRTDYWAANHHLGKYGRYAALTLLLLFTDRYDLVKTVKKRLPYKVKKRLKM